MCWGDVPQQPPTKVAPEGKHLVVPAAKETLGLFFDIHSFSDNITVAVPVA